MKRAWLFLFSLICPLAVHADSITLPNASSGQANASGSYLNLILNGVPDNNAIGGSIPGSTGVIGGQNVSFSQVFCVQLNTDIVVGSTYNASYTTNGTIDNGVAVQNAGQIAWLVQNLGPTAITEDQNLALQGAIWQVEYGSSLVYNGAFHADGSVDQAVTDYILADLLALGNNTAPISSLQWITPVNADGSYAQGLVTAVAPTPEPSSLALLGTGVLGIVGTVRKRFAA